MAEYTFTCPLEGCGMVMTSRAMSPDDAAKDLSMQAQKHLKETHPEIQKTDEEVAQDITSHMIPVEHNM